jgi:hypothetical protein
MNGLDVFIVQTVAGTDQFDTITDTDFKDATDLFDDITFSAVTGLSNREIMLILSLVRILLSEY